MDEKEQLRRLKDFVNEVLNMVEDAEIGVNPSIDSDDIKNAAMDHELICGEMRNVSFIYKKADWLKDENEQS